MGVLRALISMSATIHDISILVNIDVDRYAVGMARTRATSPIDPDARLLAALADPTRLAIVRQLAAGETCACDFTSSCDVGQPTVSHHLRVLREAGVVTSERRGQWIWYQLEPSVADRLAAIARTLAPGLITLAPRAGAPTGATADPAAPIARA